MSEDRQSDPPVLQRLYDRIWLIAALALLFFAISYVGWGFLDVHSIPSGTLVPPGVMG